jgi:hypothetical protein
MRTINQYVSKKNKKKVFSDQWRTLLNNVVMPVIRRVNARPIALDLVPVQPMPAPIGILNYIDFQYDATSESTFPFWEIKVIFKEKE